MRLARLGSNARQGLDWSAAVMSCLGREGVAYRRSLTSPILLHEQKMATTELDVEAARSAIIAGLPTRTRWMLEDTPLDFDFTQAHECLRKLTTDDFSGDMDKEWTDLLIFGRYDYAEGGGASPWITIRKTDGAVRGLDFEREPAVFVYNSSIERFIQTFSLLDRYLGHCQPLPSAIEARVREIDSDGYPASDWRLLIEYLTAE